MYCAWHEALKKKSKNERYVPIANSVYSPFDPRLLIDGQPIKFIVNPAEKILSKLITSSFLAESTKAATIANVEVELNLKFPTQLSNQGLGNGNFNPNPSRSENRKLFSAKALIFYMKSNSFGEYQS